MACCSWVVLLKGESRCDILKIQPTILATKDLMFVQDRPIDPRFRELRGSSKTVN